MRKLIEVSEDVLKDIKSRLEAGESYDAWLRRWLGLAPREIQRGRPRLNPKIEHVPHRSEWVLVADLIVGGSLVYPWIVLDNGQNDLEACARINPGVLRMARRARITVQTEATSNGLKVTRTA